MSAGAKSRPRLAFSGLVLAGGRSRRMTTDKALLQIEGRPLWQRQRDLLLAAGAAEVLISARHDQTWSAGLNIVTDPVPDCGPLGGIVAGLRAARTDLLLVVAVDLPHLPPTWLRELIDTAGENHGAIGRWPDGGFEPLAALFPRSLLDPFSADLAAHQLALQPLVAAAAQRGELRVITLDTARARELANWNEPSDMIRVP